MNYLKQYKIVFAVVFILFIFMGGYFVIRQSWFVNRTSSAGELTVVDEYIRLIQGGRPNEEIKPYLERFTKDQMIEAFLRLGLLDSNDKTVQQAGQDLSQIVFPQGSDSEEASKAIYDYITKLPRDQATRALIIVMTGYNPDDKAVKRDAQKFFAEAYNEAERQYQAPFHQLPPKEMTGIASYICQATKIEFLIDDFCPNRRSKKETDELLSNPAVQAVINNYGIAVSEIIGVQREVPYIDDLSTETIDIVITDKGNYYFLPSSGVVQDTPPVTLYK